MLSLLEQLLAESACSAQPQGQRALLFVAQQFVGSSALAWVEQHGGQPRSEHMHVALLPAVLRTVRLAVQHVAHCSSSSQRGELLEAMHAGAWLQLLAAQLQRAGYAARVEALQLAAALLEAQPGNSDGTATAGPLLAAAMRHVLIPRELWGTEHWHGKAAVREALALLQRITQAVPAAEWAEAWAGIGTTFWLSRAAADSSPAVAQRAFELLAAAVAAPATYDLLLQAWPECGDVAIKAALDPSRPAAVRGAALAVLAVALSHGPQPLGSNTPATAAEQHGGPGGPDARAEGSPCQLEPRVLPSVAVEQLLQHQQLWDGIHAILQVRCAGCAGGSEGVPLPCVSPGLRHNLPCLAACRSLKSPAWPAGPRMQHCSAASWMQRGPSWRTAQHCGACWDCQPPSHSSTWGLQQMALRWPPCQQTALRCSPRPRMQQRQRQPWWRLPLSWSQQQGGRRWPPPLACCQQRPVH